ncbi:MAG: hypothetical protein AVDCRST_MAG56-7458, partial [uncultured Cytophagales bacterium]
EEDFRGRTVAETGVWSLPKIPATAMRTRGTIVPKSGGKQDNTRKFYPWAAFPV